MAAQVLLTLGGPIKGEKGNATEQDILSDRCSDFRICVQNSTNYLGSYSRHEI